MLNIWRNQKGVSLVSVIIAAALLGGLSLLVVKLMETSNRNVKSMQVGLESIEFEALLKDVLINRDACTYTFGKVMNNAVPPVPVRNGVAPGGGNVLNSNTVNGKKGVFNANADSLWSKNDIVRSGLKLVSVKIPNERKDPNTGNMVPNYTSINSSQNKGFMEVHVELEKIGYAAKSFGADKKIIKLNLTTEVYDEAGGDYRINWCQISGAGAVAAITPDVPAGSLCGFSSMNHPTQNRPCTVDGTSYDPYSDGCPSGYSVVEFAARYVGHSNRYKFISVCIKN